MSWGMQSKPTAEGLMEKKCVQYPGVDGAFLHNGFREERSKLF